MTETFYRHDGAIGDNTWHVNDVSFLKSISARQSSSGPRLVPVRRYRRDLGVGVKLLGSRGHDANVNRQTVGGEKVSGQQYESRRDLAKAKTERNILEKVLSYFAAARAKYGFIVKYRILHPGTNIRVLGVATSGFYDGLHRPMSQQRVMIYRRTRLYIERA